MKTKPISVAVACISALGWLTPLSSYAAPSAAQTIRIDGSSTVFPITEAVAEEYQHAASGARVTVGVSGTGGGFKKFVAGEVDIVDASRPIKATEAEAARANGIGFVELPIAYDALSVVVNPKNTWVDHLTVSELRTMWSPEAQGKVTTWSAIRPGFPNKPLHLFGAGTDSGTFDYFTEVIVGKEDASRGDFTSSEDDNVLVTGVSSDESALGYFGLAFYEANKDKLKVVPIDDGKSENGAGPQAPTAENVNRGTYAPLSRPLFVYVKADALKRQEVRDFVLFYIDHVSELATEVGYIALPDALRAKVRARAVAQTEGSLYHGAQPPAAGASLDTLLATK